ncbi:unnamed protein product (macronuclear) [Paramecium tetraurelia]|uniref:tRNA-guanine(15) transglycosylase-like domain-containing protein n=1 Tax=Paramecium tetraurelia TaxID=5888 RepID=A0CRD6_PARTE|nr:uncharacterized protein GSPATT00009668001 [Paramecium tetraurelia]CAK73353.1 unnamed protein product [Paramecium tetraurelia]|eukprot:XP_001440750.1 hypothetical protein (macronuclear) [Paramecium tetraurelia strain d4-2]
MKKSPLFIYTTRMGSYYHLTPFNQQTLNLDTCLLSAGDFLHMENTLKLLQSETNISFRQYINQENKILYMTSIDSYKMKCVEGSSNKDGVKIAQLEGIKPMTNQQYIELAKTINPEMLVSLTEKLEIQAGQKSTKRSSAKSAKFLKESLDQLKDTQISIYGAIQGGLDTVSKIIAAEEQKFAIDYPNFKGFTLFGFNQGSTWQEKEDALSVVQSVFDGYNVQYILAGYGDILSILWGLSWGIEGFEIEEPFRFAQDLKVLLPPKFDAKDSELEQFSDDKINFYELEGKKINYLNFPINSDVKENVPLNPECQCFSCQNHTKLYISHLVECKEMNAQVLLTIHNTYQYQKLQQKLQEMQNKKQLNQWIRWYLQFL